MDIRKLSQNIQEETEKIIVGKSDRIRLIVMSILANGHILLDDLPGVGKTTLVKTISIALGCQSGRIQFVPDHAAQRYHRYADIQSKNRGF